MELLLLQLSLVSYLVAAVGFVAHLTAMRESLRQVGVWALFTAFVLHTLALGARAASLGHAPVVSFHDELSVLGWLIVGLFLSLQRYYPPRAIERNIEGEVLLDCLVDVAGLLDCRVVSESPNGWGFAAAAQRIARAHRMIPATRDGVAVQGRYAMRVPFQIAQE